MNALRRVFALTPRLVFLSLFQSRSDGAAIGPQYLAVDPGSVGSGEEGDSALNVPLRLTAMWRSNGSVAHEGFMVVLEIVDRRLDLLTRLFHRAHSIDDMAKHRQGLKRDHALLVFGEIAD
jgi:hypothetical protein